MSEAESSQTMDSEDDASIISTHQSESPITTDNETEKSAGQKAYSDILPILQKDLESIYKDRLLNCG